jgi:FkbM family methyltransferase
MKSFRNSMLELAYKGEVFFSRVQGIASNTPSLNGEYRLVHAVGSRIRAAIDVGCNVGGWSAELLSAAGDLTRLICVEPDPGNAARLRERFAPEAKVTVREAAAGETSGTIDFVRVGGRGSGVGHVDTAGHAASIQVEAVTLVSLIDEAGLKEVDLVKCDVEGQEMAVLRGAEPLFRRSLIGCMQVEYNSTWLRTGSFLRDLFDFAAEHRYALLCASPLGFIRYEAYGEGLEDFRMRNLVLAREDQLALLRPVPTAGRARVEASRRQKGRGSQAHVTGHEEGALAE